MTVQRFSNESEALEARESREALQAAYQLAMNWTRSFLAIDEEASKGKYQEALHLIESATWPDDVAARLRRAIETEDGDLIEQVLRDYRSRLGHAFCESCWNGEARWVGLMP
jgi:hypothetical protein